MEFLQENTTGVSMKKLAGVVAIGLGLFFNCPDSWAEFYISPDHPIYPPKTCPIAPKPVALPLPPPCPVVKTQPAPPCKPRMVRRVYKPIIKQTAADIPVPVCPLTPPPCPKRCCPCIVAYLSEGSLKANVERIARDNGWSQVVWKLPNDYHWIGRARITGTTLQAVLNVLFQSYPLEATFYEGNHVLAVTSRKFYE